MIAERASRVGETVEAYQFEDLDENIFRLWSEIYKREFRQFFHLPQIGLMREYQERINAVSDKYNLFQSDFSELLRLMALPINRSLSVMQEKVSDLAEKGELKEESQFYYNMWVKTLEGHYMSLFQTPEYMQTLAKTIESLSDFTTARNAVMEDLLSSLPIAKQSAMNDLEKEVYLLKKRIRQLEKRLSSPGHSG
jgi:polyhydroxyalkanoate synthesis regulator phasin